jgi:hypothetical protein
VPNTTTCTDPIVETVVAKLRDRSAVGVKKYGTTLASSPEGTLDFLRHAQAEMLDGANDLEWLIQQVELMAAAGATP